MEGQKGKEKGVVYIVKNVFFFIVCGTNLPGDLML